MEGEDECCQQVKIDNNLSPTEVGKEQPNPHDVEGNKDDVSDDAVSQPVFNNSCHKKGEEHSLPPDDNYQLPPGRNAESHIPVKYHDDDNISQEITDADAIYQPESSHNSCHEESHNISVYNDSCPDESDDDPVELLNNNSTTSEVDTTEVSSNNATSRPILGEKHSRPPDDYQLLLGRSATSQIPVKYSDDDNIS